MKTNVSRPQILAAAAFAAKDASSPRAQALANVRVDAKMIEASDGKVLIRVDRGSLAEGDEHPLASDPIQLPAKPVEEWARSIPRKDSPVVEVDHERTDIMGAPTILFSRLTTESERKKDASIVGKTLEVQSPEWQGNVRRDGPEWPPTQTILNCAASREPAAEVVLSVAILEQLVKAAKGLGADSVNLKLDENMTTAVRFELLGAEDSAHGLLMPMNL
tara:strand:- start:412 stop:1068 length:657 start_codon:yes stop_codon:yes gene_type:complete